MKRIAIIGTSCSGKTTLACNISKILHIPHFELDHLYWKENWQTLERELFREKVGKAVQHERWVIDGNFSIVRDLVWTRADTIIWLNYPFDVVFLQALARSIKRIVTKEQLFGNNIESFRQTFLTKNSILYWILYTHWKYKRTYSHLIRKTNKLTIELRSTRDKNNFLWALTN
jgi:adenylate kinase family enzyme